MAALVEYKFHCQTANPSHPSIQCLLGVAEKCQVPLLLAHYVADPWAFFVRPLNALARQWFPRTYQTVSERDWVTFLYRVRGREVPADLWETLEDLPEFLRPCTDD